LENVSQATCAKCEAAFTLPFKPLGYKPTFCNTCFREHRAESEAARAQRSEKTVQIEQLAITV